jgi:hypothetical protein
MCSNFYCLAYGNFHYIQLLTSSSAKNDMTSEGGTFAYERLPPVTMYL